MKKKILKVVSEFLFVFWFLSLICAPVLLFKAVSVLVTKVQPWIAVSIAISIWACVFVTGAVIMVKPWKKKDGRLA